MTGELYGRGEHSNNSYEGGTDLLSLVDSLNDAWDCREDLKVNFGSKALFIKTNLEAFAALPGAKGPGAAALVGSFTIVDHP